MTPAEQKMRTLLLKGEDEQAIGIVEELERTHPDAVATGLVRGVFYLETDQPHLAKEAFETAVHAAPEQPAPYVYRSLAFRALGQKEEAARDVAKAVGLAQGQAPELEQIVEVLMVQAHYEDATPPLERLVQEAPANLKYSYNLALCFLNTGRYAEARPIFEALCKQAPTAADLLKDMSVLLDRMGETERALDALGPFARQCSDLKLTRQAVLLLEKAGKLDKAAELADRLIQAFPGDMLPYSDAARLAEKRDKGEHQALYLHKVVDLTTGVPLWTGFHIWALVALGEHERAFQVQSRRLNILEWNKLSGLLDSDGAVPMELLAQLENAKHQAGGAPILFAACDSAYFDQYAANLTESAARNAGDFHVHIHVVCTSEDQQPDAKDMGGGTVTSEVTPQASRTYFACRRFTLMPALLTAYQQPVLCVDVDSYVNGHPGLLLEGGTDWDAQVYLREDSGEFHRWAAAGLSLFRPSPGGRRFASFVANYCQHFLDRGTEKWYLDQMALGAAYVVASQETTSISVQAAARHALDFDYFRPESIIWAAKGSVGLPVT